MFLVRYGHSCLGFETPAGQAAVLVAGGKTSEGEFAKTTEIYYFEQGRWRTAPPMLERGKLLNAVFTCGEAVGYRTPFRDVKTSSFGHVLLKP